MIESRLNKSRVLPQRLEPHEVVGMPEEFDRGNARQLIWGQSAQPT